MLPCQRKSRSQSKMRRSHRALRTTRGVQCPNCRTTKRPHAACPGCGYVRPGLKLALAKDE